MSVKHALSLACACLLSINTALPAVDNDVMQLQILQPCGVKSQMQVHKAAVQGRLLQTLSLCHPQTPVLPC